jgi:two-component system LytT family response regulator
MKPLKALIVEDNAFMAAVLEDSLKQFSQAISIIGIAPTGKKALHLIKKTHPNVVFLDIELPDMTGFELLSQLQEVTFKTIFTTAHSHYAIKAFRFNALDYLIKPIKEDEIKEAVKRLSHSTTNIEDLKTALTNLKVKTVEEQKLILPTQKGTLRFSLKQITNIEGERNYSYIYLSNGSRELSSKNLAYFEEILEDKGFFRCHRSYIINKHHIKDIRADDFILKNDVEIPISRRKKGQAKRWFIN